MTKVFQHVAESAKQRMRQNLRATFDSKCRVIRMHGNSSAPDSETSNQLSELLCKNPGQNCSVRFTGCKERTATVHSMVSLSVWEELDAIFQLKQGHFMPFICTTVLNRLLPSQKASNFVRLYCNFEMHFTSIALLSLAT